MERCGVRSVDITLLCNNEVEEDAHEKDNRSIVNGSYDAGFGRLWWRQKG